MLETFEMFGKKFALHQEHYIHVGLFSLYPNKHGSLFECIPNRFQVSEMGTGARIGGTHNTKEDTLAKARALITAEGKASLRKYLRETRAKQKLNTINEAKHRLTR